MKTTTLLCFRPPLLTLAASLLIVAAGCNSRSASAKASTKRPAAAPTRAPIVASSAGTTPALAVTPSDVLTKETLGLREALAYLASDDLEGRGLLTDGLNKAADYIADQFKSAGLEPLPEHESYFQKFSIAAGATVEPETTLTGGGRDLELNKDFSPLGVSAGGAFDAPVVFVGYSIADDGHGYNDFAKIDVKGKVALALRYGPSEGNGEDKGDAKGESGSDAPATQPARPVRPNSNTTFSAKAKAAAEHGAVALLIVNPPSRTVRDRLPSLRRSAGEPSSIPVAQITIAAADELMKRGADKTVEAIEDEMTNARKPNSFALNDVKVAGSFAVSRAKREVKNVAAVLPGTGLRKDEYVVVGAHYDHLGRGEQGSLSFNSHEIHNGADDNASGTVALVELARKLAAGGPRERSIILIAFVGEERGLLGSAHFLKKPPVPLDKIHSMLNLDMVGRVRDHTIFVGGTGTAAEFDDLMTRAAEGSPLTVKTAGNDVGGKGGFGPSDHESFALKKVPVLFLFSGMHLDYHRPTDDAEKINYEGIAQVVDLTARMVDLLAAMPRTQYVDKYDRSVGGRGAGGNNVQLGIVPDYNPDDATPGVRISGTVPETAAAKAGLKEGDVLVEMGGTKIASLIDLSSALGKAKAGDKVKLVVLRNNQRVEIEATLLERRG